MVSISIFWQHHRENNSNWLILHNPLISFHLLPNSRFFKVILQFLKSSYCQVYFWGWVCCGVVQVHSVGRWDTTVGRSCTIQPNTSVLSESPLAYKAGYENDLSIAPSTFILYLPTHLICCQLILGQLHVIIYINLKTNIYFLTTSSSNFFFCNAGFWQKVQKHLGT